MKGCVLTSDRYKRHVNSAWPFIAIGLVILSGCQVTPDPAPLEIVTRPGRFWSRQFSHASPTPVPTDVTTPGHPVAPSSTPRVAVSTGAANKPTTTGKPVTATKLTPAPSPRAQAALQFPTAKPVPDRAGYVYSPSDPSKYVDVSGYAPGSKVKDPYSGKIFLVP